MTRKQCGSAKYWLQNNSVGDRTAYRTRAAFERVGSGGFNRNKRRFGKPLLPSPDRSTIAIVGVMGMFQQLPRSHGFATPNGSSRDMPTVSRLDACEDLATASGVLRYRMLD